MKNGDLHIGDVVTIKRYGEKRFLFLCDLTIDQRPSGFIRMMDENGVSDAWSLVDSDITVVGYLPILETLKQSRLANEGKIEPMKVCGTFELRR